MDTAHWPQGIGVIKNGNQEKKPRPQKEQALNCPRCASTNTKFCYYNNYSLSQPRYFCKTCRRYWTDGGSLRSVPVGGGSRKNRRPSSSSSSSSSKKVFQDPSPQIFNPQNPKIHEGQDLNLAYNPPHGLSEFVSLPFGVDHNNPNPHFPFFKTGNFASLLGAESNSVYSATTGFPEFKPSLGFSVDNYGSMNNQGVVVHEDLHRNGNNSSRVSFPFEELKGDDDHDQLGEERETGERNNGYWNGMITGGSW